MKYWIAELDHGHMYTEQNDTNWAKIKNKTKRLSLHIDNQLIELPENMKEYVQAKTASSDLNGQNVQIESRFIGFKIGNNIVKVRVDEKTNNISIEVE